MCPYLRGTVCEMVGISAAHVDCAKTENCDSGNSLTCDVYISQFFFDSNDEYIGSL